MEGWHFFAWSHFLSIGIINNPWSNLSVHQALQNWKGELFVLSKIWTSSTRSFGAPIWNVEIITRCCIIFSIFICYVDSLTIRTVRNEDVNFANQTEDLIVDILSKKEQIKIVAHCLNSFIHIGKINSSFYSFQKFPKIWESMCLILMMWKTLNKEILRKKDRFNCWCL